MSNKLSKYLKRVMKIYSRSSMLVKTVLMEMESDNNIDKLTENVILNTYLQNNMLMKSIGPYAQSKIVPYVSLPLCL